MSTTSRHSILGHLCFDQLFKEIKDNVKVYEVLKSSHRKEEACSIVEASLAKSLKDDTTTLYILFKLF